MKNLPFEKKDIKKFTLLYGGVVVVILLFYILNINLNSIEQHEKKEFEKATTSLHELQNNKASTKANEKTKSDYKLLNSVHQ